MISLFDENFLIALADGNHIHHRSATLFFARARTDGWATCPITENGFLRILGHPGYPCGPGSPQEARPLLASYCSAPGHQFWGDETSLMDQKLIPELPPPKLLTDAYLLALAVKRGGQFVTFDRRIDRELVTGGESALVVLSV